MFFEFLYWTVGRLIKWVFRLQVEGLENLPRHGALLCPNHASDWDPVLIGVCLPHNYHLRIMAKEALFHNKALAWLIRKLGAFPVTRGTADIQSVKTAMQVIKDGQNLLIFPEGTTIRDGVGYVDGLPPHAHSGIAVIGVRSGATLVPVFADGPKKPFHKHRIIFGKPYTPVYTGRRGTSEEMQKIADRRIDKPEDVLSEGQVVDAKIIAVDEDKKKISLSIRALLDPSAETEEDGEE